MASFTYKAWANTPPTELFEKLSDLFSRRGFFLKNPSSGLCHVWNGAGECRQIDCNLVQMVVSDKLPVGIQWWRASEDIFVTLLSGGPIGGTNCIIRLIGLSREEEAEIAKLIVLLIIPDKLFFPDDYSVFELSVE